MAETEGEVAKSRRRLMLALFGILVVIVAIAGVLYVYGIWPFVQAEGAPEAVDTTSSVTPTNSVETTSPPVAVLPPIEAQEVMYWEQVASQQTITELVGDKFESFELSEITVDAETANIRVKAQYRDGTSLSGWMLLRQYDGNWFFAMITRDGNPLSTPVSGAPDLDVAKTIAEQQALNQEVVKAILDGGYTKIAVQRVVSGSGTAMVDAVYSGGTAPEARGEITCIKKTFNDASRWFITGFSKS